ncbi:MAG TPA: lysylphosphatidylglycerol synthase transmembrane domain-containing protein [Planctomycetota bacterium]
MWKKLLTAASLLLGIGLFAFVIAKFGGIRNTFNVLVEFGWAGMAIYLGIAAMTLVAPALSWTLLMRGEGMTIPLSTALKANFMGFPINFIAPTMFLGAEPLKLLYVAQKHGQPKGKVLATIIVGKFQEIGGLLFVMVVSAGIALWKIRFSREQTVLIVSAMTLLSVIFGLTLWAFLGNLQPTVKVINFLARFKRLRRRLARLRTRAEEMEHLIHAAFTHRWKLFLLAQAVTLLSAASIMLRPWVFYYFARDGHMLGIEHLCAIYLVTNVINSLPHTPGGLGIFEGGMVGLFALLGLGEANAAAYSVVNRAADLLLILFGLYLIVHLGLQSLARRVAKGEEKVRVEDAEGARESVPPTSP